MSKKFKAIIALTLTVAMCAIFCMSAMATVTGNTYPITETKTGSIGSMSVRATSTIATTTGTVTTYGSTAACYKKAYGTYIYRVTLTGERISGGSKIAETTNNTTVSVSFSVQNKSTQQSWSLNGSHVVTNDSSISMTTAVKKE